jgi:hypothetical protein
VIATFGNQRELLSGAIQSSLEPQVRPKLHEGWVFDLFGKCSSGVTKRAMLRFSPKLFLANLQDRYPAS